MSSSFILNPAALAVFNNVTSAPQRPVPPQPARGRGVKIGVLRFVCVDFATVAVAQRETSQAVYPMVWHCASRQGVMLLCG